jgi:hypothetical protein
MMDGVLCSIMTWKVIPSILIKVDKVAVCGSCGKAFESTGRMPRNMESGKSSNQSARGVDIPPTTRNLVSRTRTDVREYVPQRMRVRPTVMHTVGIRFAQADRSMVM